MKKSVLLVVLVFFALFLLLPLFIPEWTVFILALAFAKSMVVLGIVFLMWGGLITFGHGLYFAAGAYAAGFAIQWLDINDGLALVGIGLLSGGVFAAILGLLLARYRGIFFALLNMAFSMVLYALLLKMYSITGGSDGISIPPITFAGFIPPPESARTFLYYFVVVIGFLLLYVGYRFSKSPLGYALKAIHDNEVRVEYMGASNQKVIYYSYVLSGMVGGIGGVLTAFVAGHIVPEFSYWTVSGEFVFMAILGGIGNAFAPLVGSIAFEFLRYFAFKFLPYYWQMSLGIIFLLIILFLPGGLWNLTTVLARKKGK